MSKKIKALLLDLDGTLLDSKLDVARTTNATILRLGGQPLPHDTIYRYVGGGLRELMQDALPHIKTDAEIMGAIQLFDQIYDEMCLDHSVFYPGIEDTLRKFKAAGVKLAVWTNKPQSYTDKILRGLKLTDLFDAILGAGNGFPLKPELPGTQHLLAKLQVSAAEALMVGDTIFDLETAENAGMGCVLVNYGYATTVEIQKLAHRALLVTDNFGDIAKLL